MFTTFILHLKVIKLKKMSTKKVSILSLVIYNVGNLVFRLSNGKDNYCDFVSFKEK